MLHILVVYGVIKQINNQDNSYVVPFITVTVHMPKAGFKSITVSETVYNKVFDVYELSRKDLELKFFRLPYKYDGRDDDQI